MNKWAYTLAEVLITIGIIGVVAAITIPGLINNYKAARLRSQFLKSYSTVQQVFKQMEADDISLDPKSYPTGKDTLFYKTFKNYLSAPLDCGNFYGTMQNTACYDARAGVTGYTTFDGNYDAPYSYFDAGEILLQDGTLLLFENAQSNGSIWIHVDLNGYNKGPNRWGYDLFTFEFDDETLRTMGDKETVYNDLEKYCSKTKTNTLNGIACAQKAKENSDYFKTLIQGFK